MDQFTSTTYKQHQVAFELNHRTSSLVDKKKCKSVFLTILYLNNKGGGERRRDHRFFMKDTKTLGNY